MVTDQQILTRLADCGYPTGKNHSAVIDAARRGDVVIIVERTPIYVGAYSKETCRPLAEVFPDNVVIE
jgi:hypothetical protein